MSFAFTATLILFFVLCGLFVLLILVQKGRGGGISSAFGGAGGNTAFGSKTGDVLTWATSIVFAVFLIMAVALNLMANQLNNNWVTNNNAGAQTGQTDLPAELPEALPPAATDGPTTAPTQTPSDAPAQAAAATAATAATTATAAPTTQPGNLTGGVPVPSH